MNDRVQAVYDTNLARYRCNHGALSEYIDATSERVALSQANGSPGRSDGRMLLCCLRAVDAELSGHSSRRDALLAKAEAALPTTPPVTPGRVSRDVLSAHADAEILLRER